MDQSSTNINLISTKTELPEQLVAITKHLHRVGLAVIILFLALGLFFGIGITILKLRLTSLVKEKNELVTRIKAASRKESMYSVLMKQSSVALKVLGSVKPWDRVVDEINAIAPEPMFISASVSEKQNLTMTAQAASVDEAALTVETISSLSLQKKIHNAVLESLEMGADGKVKLILSFTPTL